MKQQKQYGLAKRLAMGLATAVTAAYMALASMDAHATEPKKPVAAEQQPKKTEKKEEKTKQGPKLEVSGSLDTAIMDDSVQLDGKLNLSYGKLGVLLRAMPTIAYKDGSTSTFALGALSYQMPHNLSMVSETQCLSGLGVHTRLGMGHYAKGSFAKDRLKLSTYNQLTAALQKQSDAEWLSVSTLDAKLKKVSLVANVEGVVNFGKDLNFYILRPFIGVKYKSFSVGPYMEVSGGLKGKPAVSGGVKLIVSK